MRRPPFLSEESLAISFFGPQNIALENLYYAEMTPLYIMRSDGIIM